MAENAEFSPISNSATGQQNASVDHLNEAEIPSQLEPSACAVVQKCISPDLMQFVDSKSENFDETLENGQIRCQTLDLASCLESGDAAPSFECTPSPVFCPASQELQQNGPSCSNELCQISASKNEENLNVFCPRLDDGSGGENLANRQDELHTAKNLIEVGCGDDITRSFPNTGDSISLGRVDTPEPKIKSAPVVSASEGRYGVASVVSSTSSSMAPDLIHNVKWISWHGAKTPIVTQNENGPCPLLAIINVLLLRGQIRLVDGIEIMTTESLLGQLGDCILRLIPKEMAQRPDYQQNVSDSLCILPKLSTGLDVNVKFTGVSEFEYTPECIVFDLINIVLYHGWLIDQVSQEGKNLCSLIGNLSYNQLVELIIDSKSSDNSAKVSEALLAEQFLEASASQLTDFGLEMLRHRLKDDELGVFFRNNHFSTLLKHNGSLLLLVTDLGFLNEHNVVWQSLDDVGGWNSKFLNAEFKLSPPKSPGGFSTEPSATSCDKQMENDLLVAMSLSREENNSHLPMMNDKESDRQLALMLQREEQDLRGDEEKDRKFALMLQKEEETPRRGRCGGDVRLLTGDVKYSQPRSLKSPQQQQTPQQQNLQQPNSPLNTQQSAAGSDGPPCGADGQCAESRKKDKVGG